MVVEADAFGNHGEGLVFVDERGEEGEALSEELETVFGVYCFGEDDVVLVALEDLLDLLVESETVHFETLSEYVGDGRVAVPISCFEVGQKLSEAFEPR